MVLYIYFRFFDNEILLSGREPMSAFALMLTAFKACDKTKLDSDPITMQYFVKVYTLFSSI